MLGCLDVQAVCLAFVICSDSDVQRAVSAVSLADRTNTSFIAADSRIALSILVPVCCCCWSRLQFGFGWSRPVTHQSSQSFCRRRAFLDAEGALQTAWHRCSSCTSRPDMICKQCRVHCLRTSDRTLLATTATVNAGETIGRWHSDACAEPSKSYCH